MTTTYPTAGALAAPAAASTAHVRDLSLDRARTFLTILVLIHHSVIPYTHFGHTDEKSWIGFDCVVLATDSFFMAMFFMLSGLFLWPSLDHRPKMGTFARDRLIRLGIPFAIAAVTVIPIAYYALALQQNPDTRFTEFWWNMITVGPWPSGPLWFLWVLLIFSVVGGTAYRISRRTLDPLNRLAALGFARPGLYIVAVFAITAVLYVPARVYFGPNQWFEFGPFSVQASRVLLYAAYFFIGAGIGACHPERGVLSAGGRLAQQWHIWALLALVPYAAMWGFIGIKRGILDNPPDLPAWYEAGYGLAFTAFSVTVIFAILAYFLRFKRAGWSILDPLQHDAYGIFLVHYAWMLWLQYALFNVDLPAIAKAAIVFTLGLLLSWATTAGLRKIPGAYRVL
ncbi:acyltransferase [Rhodopseudomonas palustris]|uniref:acyltransferase family protein n=1 Tax=Rhodopseudomonas palustris TaxID=1076 RepID=UPI002ACE3F79|nr:acyltransferase [Rhodopseudomonas palustris]WQH01767.1 acyltransferase [Rhodopseudomonas palustris]